MTAPISETQRIRVESDERAASQRDVARIDRDVRITSSLGFLGTIAVVLLLAGMGYSSLTEQISDYAKDRDADRNEIVNLKTQLAGVSAQLVSIATDLKIANAVNVARSSDRWTTQMMAEFTSQLKGSLTGVQGMAWADYPNVRNIQAAVGQPGGIP